MHLPTKTKAELAFAGHPTIGAAVLIGELRAASLMRSQDVRIVLEEPVGDLICHARHRPGKARQADFILPKLPALIGDAQPKAKIAAALVSLVSSSTPFVLVVAHSSGAFVRAIALERKLGSTGSPAVAKDSIAMAAKRARNAGKIVEPSAEPATKREE